jgi:hypothetical protein
VEISNEVLATQHGSGLEVLNGTIEGFAAERRRGSVERIAVGNRLLPRILR